MGKIRKMWNEMLLTSAEVCDIVMEQLTWKKEKSNVKYITKEYEKGITYSKEVISQYEGVNIYKNEGLKKLSIIITPLI